MSMGLLIFLIVSWIIILFAVLMFVFSSLQKKNLRRISEEFKNKEVLLMSSGVNFFGQESGGIAQLRGNGSLILTKEELFYQMWMPKREIRISISSIYRVELVKSFLGRRRPFFLFLKVVFTSKEGKQDSIAWLVKNPKDWKQKIEELIVS